MSQLNRKKSQPAVPRISFWYPLETWHFYFCESFSQWSQQIRVARTGFGSCLPHWCETFRAGAFVWGGMRGAPRCPRCFVGKTSFIRQSHVLISIGLPDVADLYNISFRCCRTSWNTWCRKTKVRDTQNHFSPFDGGCLERCMQCHNMRLTKLT